MQHPTNLLLGQRPQGIVDALAPALASMWSFSSDTTAAIAPAREWVHADACIDLIVMYGRDDAGRPKNLRLLVAGPSKLARVMPHGECLEFAGLSLRPGMARAALGLDVPGLVDRSVGAAQLSGELQRIEQRIGDSRTPQAALRAAVVELRALLQRNKYPGPSPRVLEAIRRLSDDPSTVMTALARDVAMSERTLRREIVAWTGLSPKQLLGVQRFRAALHRLQSDLQISLAQLAYECGFQDQAHLTNQFRSMAGTTPGRFIAA